MSRQGQEVSHSRFCKRFSTRPHSDANLHYSIDSASLNNSKELHIRNFQLQTCVRKRQSLKCLFNLQISKWRISKIGLLQECLVVQKIPKKLNGRKLKQSLNMAQEISWSV